jgi:hypothetical protein
MSSGIVRTVTKGSEICLIIIKRGVEQFVVPKPAYSGEFAGV